MAYEMLTRTGRSFWEITSVMQNSIRKGDYELAGYCMWELLPKYDSYLRKRFLVISAEDCFGVITKEILHLCSIPGDENLERALSMLCRCKKNRDADYFVCNLMGGKLAESMNKEELASGMIKAIRAMDVRKAGEFSYGLFKKNRKHLWVTLNQMAKESNPCLMDEFDALHEANERVSKPTEETIFAAKAIVLIWTKADSLGHPGMRYDGTLNPDMIDIIKPCDQCRRVEGFFPEWTYNWHTYHGKYKLRRDAIHAISNDQRILTPLEVNLFDDCTWNRDINACLHKWNPRNVPIPYDDGKVNPEEKFPGKPEEPKEPEPEQMNLFQMFGSI